MTPLKNRLTRRAHQTGLTLLEVLISIAILGAVIAGSATLIDNHLERMRIAATAQHMAVFGKAVNEFIKDNYNDFVTPGNGSLHGNAIIAATANTPSVITVDLIQNTPSNGQASLTRYLPANFNPVNGHGQTICALVLQPKPNELYALVVSEGGTAINDVDLGLLAGTIGAAGGGIYSAASSIAKGTMGKWYFNLNTDPVGSNFRTAPKRCNNAAGSIAFAAGHPLMALWFSEDTSSAFLYRDEVPGHPELNQMQTDIRFKDDITTTDPITNQTTVTPGASLTLQVERGANTLCDDTPTSKQGYLDKTGTVQSGVPPGTLARDRDGNLMMCVVYPASAGGDDKRYWRTVAKAMFWGDAVPRYADLPPCSATENPYQTRIVKEPANKVTTTASMPRAYTCYPSGNKGEWQALAVDDNGVLSTDLLKLGFDPARVDDGSCSSSGLGAVTRDIFGQLLVCTLVQNQFGIPVPHWKGSAAIGNYRFQISGYSEYFIGTGHMSADGHFSGTLYCGPEYGFACGSGGTITCYNNGMCARSFALRGLSVGWWGWLLDPMNKPMRVDVAQLKVANFTRHW